jgi:hypothetical protein
MLEASRTPGSGVSMFFRFPVGAPVRCMRGWARAKGIEAACRRDAMGAPRSATLEPCARAGRVREPATVTWPCDEPVTPARTWVWLAVASSPHMWRDGARVTEAQVTQKMDRGGHRGCLGAAPLSPSVRKTRPRRFGTMWQPSAWRPTTSDPTRCSCFSCSTTAFPGTPVVRQRSSRLAVGR